jgi:hypothetical protein
MNQNETMEFFGDQLTNAYGNTSDDLQSQAVKYPGKYRCRSVTRIFRMGKARDGTPGELVVYPKVSKTDKGNLQLSVSLEVLDGTPQVPKGSYITAFIILVPKPGTEQSKFNNIIKFTKPKLVAMTGQRGFVFNHQWMMDNLTVDFTEKDGQFIVTREHKMHNDVMVGAELGEYQNKPVIRAGNIEPAGPNDKSVTIAVVSEGTPGASGVDGFSADAPVSDVAASMASQVMAGTSPIVDEEPAF